MTRYLRGWAWYESLFLAAVGKLAIGEGSTGYTKELLHPHTAERIAKYLPEAKLIYIVRNPFHRIESHWLHSIACGLEVPPLREALKKWPHMVDISLYWKQISRYRQVYPDKQILVLFFEDFVKQPQAVVDQCYEYLGVDPNLAEADPAKASHVSANARIDGPIIRLLRRMPGGRSLKKLRLI